jgi:3-dehydroquinate dehydratase-2
MMTQSVMVLNGPNLNLLGQREPGIYGADTLSDVEARCRNACAKHGFTLQFHQSNHEGELIDWLHAAGAAQARGELAGVVFNAGAYTHTSVALHDAIKGAQVKVIELHISNVHAREPFRHHSFLSPAVQGVIAGFGVDGYQLAISALALGSKAAEA